MSVREIERAFGRICLSRSPSEADVARLGGASVLIYRDLVRSRFREVIAIALPKTERVVGREAISQIMDDFLAESPPSSRYFREVVPSFVEFLVPRILQPSFPTHAADVARLEGTQWELGWRHAEIETGLVEFDLERVAVTHPTLRLLHFEHAVHLAYEDAPRAGSFDVCVHRRPDHRVETRTLDATGARLIAAWMRGTETAIEGVRAVLMAQGQQADSAFVERMGSLLAGLLESGGILGSRPDGAS